MPDGATRPLRADARHNRARIIEAARELLAEQGAEVPLDQIAARADVSIATFYRRFTDRLDLFAAVLIEESEGLVAALGRIVDLLETDPTRGAWATAMHDLVVSAQSRLVPLLAILNSGLMHEVPDLTRAHTSVRSLTRSMIVKAQDAGLVRTELAPDEVFAMLFVATQPVPNLPSDDNRALTSRTVQVLLAGLHPDPDHAIGGDPPRLDHQHPRSGPDIEAAGQGSKR